MSERQELVAAGMVPWKYGIELRVKVTKGEEDLDLYRYGIASLSELEFMVSVILLKVRDVASIKVSGSYKPSKTRPWVHVKGEVKKGKIVWDGEGAQ